MKILALLTDAYGGRGGIAKFNRDLLNAFCSFDNVEKVIALPRIIKDDVGELSPKLNYNTGATGSIGAYMKELGALLFLKKDSFDLVVCGHINLVPIAVIAAKRLKVPCVLIIHGIDAWENPNRLFLKKALKQVDHIVSVSEFTKDNFLKWSDFDKSKVTVIPNCIELNKFEPGPKPEYLEKRYQLNSNRKIILTLGRLAGRERAKGFDEILEVMPDLLSENPGIRYMIAGDGPDKNRLQEKAIRLNIEEQVIFTGYVPEEEKADHYRLADVFAMPARGEGFGIVYLEAMACGIPVVASSADASKEAVLNGEIGEVANPDNSESIKRSIMKCLHKEKNVPKKLNYFTFEAYSERWEHFLVGMMTPE